MTLRELVKLNAEGVKITIADRDELKMYYTNINDIKYGYSEVSDEMLDKKVTKMGVADDRLLVFIEK